jgi:DNA-binding NarL/FixJ family response regulator
MPTRILIVEDDPLIAMDLQGIVERAGYGDVRLAYNMQEARKAFEDLESGFVFLDINLDQRHGGTELAKEIREKYPFPFAFVTANTDDDTLEQVQQSRPAGFIVKPFDEKEILAVLKIGLFALKNQTSSAPKKIGIELIQNRFPSLSESESKMLLGIYQAKTNKEIADSVFLSVNTVKSHLKTLYLKLGVNSRVEAVQKLLNTL